MEDNMVGSSIDQGTVVAQADAAYVPEVEVVTVDDIFSKPQTAPKQNTHQQQNTAKAQEQAQQPGANQPTQQPVPPQSDLDRAFSERAKAAKRQGFEEAARTDEYNLGQMLINAEMRSKGVSRDQAIRNIQESSKQQRAAHFKSNPDALVDALTNVVMNPQTAQQYAPPPQQAAPQTQSNILSQEFVFSITNGVNQAIANGVLPQNFKETGITSKFVEYASKHSVSAAIDHMAEVLALTQNRSASADAIVARVDQRRAEQKPIQPSGEIAQPGPHNYKKLSKEQWQEASARLRAAAEEGKPMKP